MAHSRNSTRRSPRPQSPSRFWAVVALIVLIMVVFVLAVVAPVLCSMLGMEYGPFWSFVGQTLWLYVRVTLMGKITAAVFAILAAWGLVKLLAKMRRPVSVRHED